MIPKKVTKYIFKFTLELTKEQAEAFLYNLSQINNSRLQDLAGQLQAQINNINYLAGP